jgi:hypothetical protein
MQDAFRSASLVTDGAHVFTFAAPTTDEHIVESVSITLTGNDDDDDDDVAVGDDDDETDEINHLSAPPTTSGSRSRKSSPNRRPHTAARVWTSLGTVEQFVEQHARSRLSRADVTLLARCFLRLVPVLAASPLTVPAPTPSEESGDVVAQGLPHVDNALQQFTKLRETIARLLHLHRERDINDANTADGDGSCADAKWEHKHVANWSIHDGESLYIADRIDVPATSAELTRLAERECTATRGRWRRMGTIDACVRAALRTAFPDIVAAVNSGQRDDADLRRVCIAGEFYVREHVAYIGHGIGMPVVAAIPTVGAPPMPTSMPTSPE